MVLCAVSPCLPVLRRHLEIWPWPWLSFTLNTCNSKLLSRQRLSQIRASRDCPGLLSSLPPSPLVSCLLSLVLCLLQPCTSLVKLFRHPGPSTAPSPLDIFRFVVSWLTVNRVLLCLGNGSESPKRTRVMGLGSIAWDMPLLWCWNIYRPRTSEPLLTVPMCLQVL